MKGILSTLALLSMLLLACRQGSSSFNKQPKKSGIKKDIIRTGNTIATRFSVPDGFVRIAADSSSFALYLRNLPLKPRGSLVSYYNGATKPNDDIYDAVVDLPIGQRDLHQCADALIRLRADYLYSQKKFNDIHFNFTNGFRASYSEWIKGKRITVDGNNVYWAQKTLPSNTYSDFWKYLELIFSYAGTASLSDEMKPIDLKKLKAGDVFIQGGFPGHAIIVADVAKNKKTGEKIFLLAQSYMPAQEIQLLKNPNDTDLSPWYNADFGEHLITPEWTFKAADLKRFQD